MKKVLQKIIENKFRERYKDSSLFNSWDNCEKDLVKWIISACEIAYNEGWKDKAVQMLEAMKGFSQQSNTKI